MTPIQIASMKMNRGVWGILLPTTKTSPLAQDFPAMKKNMITRPKSMIQGTQENSDPALPPQHNLWEETNISSKTSLANLTIIVYILIQRGKEFQRIIQEELEMSRMGNLKQARQSKKCKLENDI